MRQWIAAAEAELDIELALDGLRGTAPVTRAADTPRPVPGTGGGSAVHAVAWEQARVRARDSAGRPLPVVVRDLDAALGHALAAPLTALTDLPPFDTSAMDGWVVAGQPYRTTVVAALPGHAHDTRLLPVRRVGHEVAPLPFGGPAMLRGLALVDGLAVVPPGGVPAGADVEVLEVPGQRARETFADGAEEWVGAC
ncbi:hypothetical protein OG361_03175 [Streptomyces sp. NBC_00090]